MMNQVAISIIKVMFATFIKQKAVFISATSRFMSPA